MHSHKGSKVTGLIACRLLKTGGEGRAQRAREGRLARRAEAATFSGLMRSGSCRGPQEKQVGVGGGRGLALIQVWPGVLSRETQSPRRT